MVCSFFWIFNLGANFFCFFWWRWFCLTRFSGGDRLSRSCFCHFNQLVFRNYESHHRIISVFITECVITECVPSSRNVFRHQGMRSVITECVPFSRNAFLQFSKLQMWRRRQHEYRGRIITLRVLAPFAVLVPSRFVASRSTRRRRDQHENSV